MLLKYLFQKYSHVRERQIPYIMCVEWMYWVRGYVRFHIHMPIINYISLTLLIFTIVSFLLHYILVIFLLYFSFYIFGVYVSFLF